MEKRTLLAVVLSAVVWIGWFLLVDPQTKKTEQPAKPVVSSEEKKLTEPSVNDKVQKPVRRTNAPVAIAGTRNTGKEKKVTLESEKYTAVFNSRGAVIEKLLIKDRNVEVTVKESPFKAKGILDFPIHFNDNEFLSGNALDQTVWSMRQKDGVVIFGTFFRLNGIPLEIQKHFIFQAKTNSFIVEYHFINRGRHVLTLPNSSVIISPTDIVGPRLDYTNSYNTLSGVYSQDGDFETEAKGSGMFSKAGILKKQEGNIEYAGVSSRYILALMKPKDFTISGSVMDNRKGTGFRTGMYIKVDPLQPGAEVVRAFTVYVGEKKEKLLIEVDPGFKEADDVSLIIEPIRKFVLFVLLKLNGLFGNLGWSLVVFSILTKIVFMPLTKKSTDSMKKMQALTPKINELKAKYKDKPDVMQREMMGLYKENKVNPMGGCLPILLQMPFFFALYSALINGIDLWQAPFMLWMQDLSMPDTIAQVAGFNVNILPVLMTISTFLQQKLTTVDTGAGQQQKIMMTVMPLMFIFIFWSMPSGLVLYWTLQNVFQVAHQLVVNKFGKEKN